jgi:hypothetical protein
LAQTSRSLEVGIIANPEVTPVIINEKSCLFVTRVPLWVSVIT